MRKGVEGVASNANATKNEIREYIARHINELRRREEHFLAEVDAFRDNEQRLMQTLHDVLDVERCNLDDACAAVDSALAGQLELRDKELCRLKTKLVDGIEYLRNFQVSRRGRENSRHHESRKQKTCVLARFFLVVCHETSAASYLAAFHNAKIVNRARLQPDADELFSKKIRFSPGDDASKMPTAISNFGELTVSSATFSGRYLPLEQSYLPRAPSYRRDEGAASMLAARGSR